MGMEGEHRFFRRFSGPLQVGEVRVSIQVDNDRAALDDRQTRELKEQVGIFVSTLGMAVALQPPLILAQRLLQEASPEAFNRLLRHDSHYEFWMIQAWAAETRHLLQVLPDKEQSLREQIKGLAERLRRWVWNLNLDDIRGLSVTPEPQADWLHLSAYARQQAANRMRQAKHASAESPLVEPRPLLAWLRQRLRSGGKLLFIGVERTNELAALCLDQVVAQNVVQVDFAQDVGELSRSKQAIENRDVIGVMLLGLDQISTEQLQAWCYDVDTPCVSLDEVSLEAAEAALQTLEAALQKR